MPCWMDTAETWRQMAPVKLRPVCSVEAAAYVSSPPLCTSSSSSSWVKCFDIFHSKFNQTWSSRDLSLGLCTSRDPIFKVLVLALVLRPKVLVSVLMPTVSVLVLVLKVLGLGLGLETSLWRHFRSKQENQTNRWHVSTTPLSFGTPARGTNKLCWQSGILSSIGNKNTILFANSSLVMVLVVSIWILICPACQGLGPEQWAPESWSWSWTTESWIQACQLEIKGDRKYGRGTTF